MDIFEKCYSYSRVTKAKELGIYPYFHCLTCGQDTEVIMGGHHTYMLGSNNYLGLTADERVKTAVKAAVDIYGSGCSGSRFLNGTLDIHELLEAEIADFLNFEACLSFSTGFQSNLAIISAVAGRNDFILCDALNHASILDGTRLSFAKTFKYRHSDMEDLARRLKTLRQDYPDRGILIVTDGVFSMEGEICKLPEIVELARQYGARTLVDDAHALGVLGVGGRGTASHFGLESEVDLVMNTFSKTLASLGGCVVGQQSVIDYIKHTSRPFIFSASIPPAQVAAARKALEILQAEPWRVERLHEIVRKVKERFSKSTVIRLRESGNDLVPIVPLLTGTVGKTMFTANYLFANEVYVNPVFPPVVPADSCLLRTSFMASHTDEQIESACSIIERCLFEIEQMDQSQFDIDF